MWWGPQLIRAKKLWGQKHYQGEMARNIALRSETFEYLPYEGSETFTFSMQGGHKDEFFSLRFHRDDIYEYHQTSGFL